MSNNEHVKVFVCKYVGTPGVDERLQGGGNPISVDYHPGREPGGFFEDGQGRSFSIAYDIGQPEPDPAVACPLATGTTLPPVTTLPPEVTTTLPSCPDCVINTVVIIGETTTTLPPESSPLTPPINEPATVEAVVATGIPPTTTVEPQGATTTTTTVAVASTPTLPATGNNIEILSFASSLLLIGLLATWIAHRRSRPDHEGDSL